MSKIIHVDNSDFFRKLVKTFLSERGFWVESFDQGTEALREIKNGETALIITGLSFSDMTGEDFVKKVLEYSHAIPIITLTGSQSAKLEQELQALGIKAQILKSSSWQDELLPLVNQYFPK